MNKEMRSKKKHFLLFVTMVTMLLGAITVNAKTIKEELHLVTYLANTKGELKIATPESGNRYTSVNEQSLFPFSKKPKKVKSSNTKVLTAKVYKCQYPNEKPSYYVWVEAKKPGKATVTFEVGKDTYIYPVKVVKYTAPFTSLKINGKEYASKIKSSQTLTLPYSKYKGKTVTLKAIPAKVFKGAEGWPYFYGNLSKYSGTWKNGSYDKFKFKVTKKGCGVYAWIRRTDVPYGWGYVYIVFK